MLCIERDVKGSTNRQSKRRKMKTKAETRRGRGIDLDTY